MQTKKIETEKEADPQIIKTVIPITVLGLGVLMGGMALQGIYTGMVTAVGFMLLLEKCKEHYPSFYNWTLDNAVEADFIVSGMAVLFLGFSVTGIIAGAVVNVLCSIGLDYYRTNVGKVKGVESMTFASLMHSVKNKMKKKNRESYGEGTEEVGAVS